MRRDGCGFAAAATSISNKHREAEGPMMERRLLIGMAGVVLATLVLLLAELSLDPTSPMIQ
jgi:hypothetical protein